MLARKRLIDLKHEFFRIRKEGKIYDTPLFGLIVSFSLSDTAKTAFIVSKKVSLKAVDRHDLKRRLAKAVTYFLPNINKNVELTFLAKQKALKSTDDEIKKTIEEVLRRARLLHL